MSRDASDAVSRARLTGEDSGNNNNNNNGKDDVTSPSRNQQVSSVVAQLIHAKCTALTHFIPGLTLELFEINETDVHTLSSDQLFGPYVLPANTAAVVLVVDCAQLFPAPPNCSLLVESVDSVIQQIERKKREAYQREVMLINSAGFASLSEPPSSTKFPSINGQQQEEQTVPTLCEVLETFRSRQDTSAEQYIQQTAERIQSIRTALDTWAGDGASQIPIHVAIHNTEIVAPRLEAWSLTSSWAKLSDASRAQVLSKIPTKGQSQDAGVRPIQIPSLQSCCAPEPFVQGHLSLHRSYPLVSVTVRAIRSAMNQIANRANGTLFFPSLTSILDQSPVALLSSIVARPQVYPNSTHLQEIVHSFKNRCFFRRVFVIEPRTLIAVAGDRAFMRFVSGLGRSQGEQKENVVSLLAQHPSPLARAAGTEGSFNTAQTFVQDYLNVVDALKLGSMLSLSVNEDFASEATLIKASFGKEEQGEILMNVAEGGFAAYRGSLELTNGEGVYLYGLAPPVGLILGCIGDCVEVQRMQSLIEFNLHIVQETVAGLFEETMKRARAAGYSA